MLNIILNNIFFYNFDVIFWKSWKRIVGIRVIYRNRKNYSEIPAFLPVEQGKSRAEKFKVIQHFAVIEIYLCFHLIFPLLELLIRNSKRWYYVISKYMFLLQTLSSVYNPGWIWKIDKWNFFDSDDFYVVYFGTFFEQWDFWPFLSFHNICTFYANSQNVLKDFIAIINQCICKFKCLKTQIYQKVATHFVNVLGKVHTYM